jgi:GDP-4-dehydro-6-deoxy-D-mannose reductase
MRALITGVGGFVGRHLLHHLLEEGDEVYGLGRATDLQDVRAAGVFTADLADKHAIERVISEVEPEAVYHLAAQSSPAESLADPWATLGNNLQAQMNLFEALLCAGLRPRTLVVGSSDEYGLPDTENIPTNENVPLKPRTPYAVSKVGQDVMGFQYFAQRGLPVVRVRPFNHTGPGHDARFVVPSLARQLAEIEAGQREPVLRVGNVDVARDFTDARDMVRAYRLAIIRGAAGDVYNLGRGRSIRIGDIIADLLELCTADIETYTDPALARPADIPRQEADVRKFRSLTGWEPRIPWQTTLADTLVYWRDRVRVASRQSVRSG